MNVTIEKKHKLFIISISGRLVASNAAELETAFKDISRDKKTGKRVISLKGLEYISSAGLSVFLAFAKMIDQQQQQLCFVHLGSTVKRVFKISGFYSLFKIFDTIDDIEP